MKMRIIHLTAISWMCYHKPTSSFSLSSMQRKVYIPFRWKLNYDLKWAMNNFHTHHPTHPLVLNHICRVFGNFSKISTLSMTNLTIILTMIFSIWTSTRWTSLKIWKIKTMWSITNIRLVSQDSQHSDLLLILVFSQEILVSSPL